MHRSGQIEQGQSVVDKTVFSDMHCVDLSLTPLALLAPGGGHSVVRLGRDPTVEAIDIERVEPMLEPGMLATESGNQLTSLAMTPV